MTNGVGVRNLAEREHSQAGNMTAPAKDPVSASIRLLRGIGTLRAAELEKIGIKKIADLLYYLPRRYLDRSTIVKCRDLREGLEATVVGKITAGRLVPGGRRQRYELTLADGTGF